MTLTLCACGCGEPTKPGKRFVGHHNTRVMPIRSLAERFWEKVAKSAGCWLWIGSTNNHGYGQIGAGSRGESSLLAHRVSWEINVGPIPEGLQVLHDCPGGDNPACVNPAHLFLGDQIVNMRDAARKGRISLRRLRGEQNPASKLTLEAAREIRRLWAAGDVKQRDLAQRFGVAQSQIWSVLSGRRWTEPATETRELRAK